MIIKKAHNPNEGLRITKALLYKHTTKKTVLFLSGGTTPKLLYEDIAMEKKLALGAVALVDERVGSYFHKDSNEKMINDTGLIGYLKSKKRPFYGILRSRPKDEVSDLVRNYEKDIIRIMSDFPRRIAIMGIGEDGHIAGLPASPRGEPPGGQNSKLKTQKYVVGVRDFPGEFKKRITLTFKALSKMDLLIIMAFGSAKKNILRMMLEKGSKEEIPARFYTKPGISEKTILITDQKV